MTDNDSKPLDQFIAARLLVWSWIKDGGAPPSAASFDDPKGFLAQTARAAEGYLAVLSAQGKPRPTRSDVMISALLARLLSGQQPLPEPPPLSDGMPWYEVIEDMGPLRCRLEMGHDRQVMVNGTTWMVERTEGDDLILRWREGSPLFRAWPDHADSLPSAWWIGCHS